MHKRPRVKNGVDYPDPPISQSPHRSTNASPQVKTWQKLWPLDHFLSTHYFHFPICFCLFIISYICSHCFTSISSFLFIVSSHFSWHLALPSKKPIRNRLTTSPLPLPRSPRRSISPEVHAISNEWISLTVGRVSSSPPAAPTPPLPPLPSASYCLGEYLSPSMSASPVPPISGSPYCVSPMASPSTSPLPPPYPPRPCSATPFLTFTPPQGEDFLLSPPSPRLSRSLSPCGGAGLEGWLTGVNRLDQEFQEGDGAEIDRAGSLRKALYSRNNSPAEVSSAWCGVFVKGAHHMVPKLKGGHCLHRHEL